MKVFCLLRYLFIFLLNILACFWSDQLIGSSCFSSRFFTPCLCARERVHEHRRRRQHEKKKSLNRFFFLNNLHSNRHPPPPPSSCCAGVCSLSLSRRPLRVTSCFGDTSISSPPAWRHSSRLVVRSLGWVARAEGTKSGREKWEVSLRPSVKVCLYLRRCAQSGVCLMRAQSGFILSSSCEVFQKVSSQKHKNIRGPVTANDAPHLWA